MLHEESRPFGLGWSQDEPIEQEVQGNDRDDEERGDRPEDEWPGDHPAEHDRDGVLGPSEGRGATEQEVHDPDKGVGLQDDPGPLKPGDIPGRDEVDGAEEVHADRGVVQGNSNALHPEYARCLVVRRGDLDECHEARCDCQRPRIRDPGDDAQNGLDRAGDGVGSDGESVVPREQELRVGWLHRVDVDDHDVSDQGGAGNDENGDSAGPEPEVQRVVDAVGGQQAYEDRGDAGQAGYGQEPQANRHLYSGKFGWT